MDLMKDIPFESPNAENETSKSNTSSTASNSSSPSSIHFRNQTIPISNHSLLVAMLKLDTLVSSYNKHKSTSKGKSKKFEDAFLDLLSGYDDANVIVTKEFKEMEGMKSGPAVDSKKQELQSISGFLNYQKTKLLMERNEQMLNALRSQSKSGGGHESKLYEIVHLYNALLQDARTVVSLPGGPVVVNEEGIVVPVEDDFVLEANAHILRFRALRCYYLGRLYSEQQQKYKEAIALFDHALELANEAAEELNACTSDDNDEKGTEMNLLVESMVDLEKEISGAKCRSEAYHYLCRMGKTPSSSSRGTRSLLDRLDDFDGGNESGGAEKYHLATVPPALQYIPCKPAFFDIALNHIEDLPVEQMNEIVEQNAPKSSSILGWFRRS